jgi:UDP-glucose 4-epimerase
MKIIVTGGAGFIGSHLVDRLLVDNHEIVVIDNFVTGKLDNLPKLSKEFKIFNISILENIDNLFKDVDGVFHLAALTRPRESMWNKEGYYKTNVCGTIKVLNACQEFKVKNIVFVSSASTYGFQDKFPTKEIDIQKPDSPYAITKYLGEDLCKFYRKMWGMNISIVRPFNVYGKRQDPNGPYGAAIPKFIDYLKIGKKPFITGDGQQFRDFIYIDDLIELLVKVMNKNINEIFNAGSGLPTNINDLYNLISKIMVKQVKPRHTKEVKEPNTHADINKAEKLLDWKPKINLEEGLMKII